MRSLVRTFSGDCSEYGRAVSCSFLDDGNVFVLCDDGAYRVLTQAGMVAAWEGLWRDTADGPTDNGWERS